MTTARVVLASHRALAIRSRAPGDTSEPRSVARQFWPIPLRSPNADSRPAASPASLHSGAWRT
ncbi:hypothetical protein ColTof4_09019 [Colletotrichum tofieldiae]|nr:hypothetical protein ColTof3_03772 [Colletotrichum tofieldiae]GKT76596.1 hypothetical protein ColTof4_09019 [Colletotrichum tofieldiae]